MLCDQWISRRRDIKNFLDRAYGKLVIGFPADTTGGKHRARSVKGNCSGDAKLLKRQLAFQEISR
jgi:hypothetical protein